jgi:hypothetical protein
MRKLVCFTLSFLLGIWLAFLCVAFAADITGTWRGMLTSNGESGEVEVVFSSTGYPIYSYTNNRGITRQVELRQPGQRIEYVPQGGGVQTVVVNSIIKQPGRVVFSLSASFEKASGGYLDQQQESTAIEYELIPQGLRMRITSQSASPFGDKDMSVGGNPNKSVAEGILQKVQ